MSGSFIFPGTHRNTSAKMTENMAAGLKQERQKKTHPIVIQVRPPPPSKIPI